MRGLAEVRARLGARVEPSFQDITSLLAKLADGNQDAAGVLVPLVYEELHRLAVRRLRHERPNHTLQPTALVHEAYLKLVGQRNAKWQNRVHFFAVASQLMRRILVDYARGHLRAKRGGKQMTITLEGIFPISREDSHELLALDECLNRLQELDARQARIIELRFFGGLSVEETAEALGISPKTVKREWQSAKAWLYGELKERHGSNARQVGQGKGAV